MSHKSEKKVVKKYRNNILLKSSREVSAYFREVSAYFQEASAYFREVSAYFFSKLVSIFFLETSFEKLWQPGVYNDTNTKPRGSFIRPLNQGRKRNPNLNFLVRIFSGGVGVFHVKGWGPKSSVCPSKPGKSNFLGGISRDFAGISRRCPKSLRKSAAAFWGFSRGGFPENACIGGAVSERNFCEICRRKSPQNTEKHKTKLSAEVPERPPSQRPLFFSC